jgi:hypothetical protein
MKREYENRIDVLLDNICENNKEINAKIEQSLNNLAELSETAIYALKNLYIAKKHKAKDVKEKAFTLGHLMLAIGIKIEGIGTTIIDGAIDEEQDIEIKTN